MAGFTRSVLVALCVGGLIALLRPSTTSAAMATPVSLEGNYPLAGNESQRDATTIGFSSENFAVRAELVINPYLQELSDYLESIDGILKVCRRNRHTTPSANLRQDCVAESKNFYDRLLGLQNILQNMGGDKGLANYDNSNEVERLLKAMVNIIKDTLNCIYLLLEDITMSLLGPVLGPPINEAFYDIKCLIDEILNATENTTDFLLNKLLELIQLILALLQVLLPILEPTLRLL